MNKTGIQHRQFLLLQRVPWWELFMYCWKTSFFVTFYLMIANYLSIFH